MNPFKSTALFMTGVSVLALASTAHAQTAAPGDQPAQASEIVVTGSRVVSNGNNMPTPVTVVSVEQMEQLAPGPVAMAIEELPALASSRLNTANPGSGTSNAEALTFNLRDLSYVRTLTLFDGNRLAPSTYDQLVDASDVPQMLLQRVDIVTGGVSAVYGSDAVAGVVNFVTDSKFNGFKIDVSGGVSNYGDEHRVTADVAAGTKLFDGRGHIEAGFQYIQDPGISFRTARPWTSQDWCLPGAGTAAAPLQLHSGCRFSTYAFGGLITATGAGAALNNKYFPTNGVLSTFDPGTPTGQAGYAVGGNGAVHDGSLATAVTSDQVFGRFDFDVTNSVHFYVQGGGTINHVLSYAGYNILNAVTMNGQNAFLPAANQFVGTFKLSEFIGDMPRIDTNTHQNEYFIVGGFSGDVNLAGNSYNWKLNGQDSVAQTTTRNDENISIQNLDAAEDAVVNNGQIVCRASLTNSAYSNCVPLNLFGPTAASAAALAYITAPTQYTVRNGLIDFNGSLSGSPFKDWAGPVTVALSGEWRRNTFSVFSTGVPTPIAYANCAGLTLNCVQGTTGQYLDGTLADRSPIGVSVGEVALEAEVPLLHGVPFAEDVSLNGAYRYTDYSTSGGVSSWKIGLTWQVDDELKLRAVRSQDIRAPNLYELFQPRTVSNPTNITDTLTGVTGPTTVVSGGNPNLVPEVAQTTTAGFVYSPKWVPGRFSISMDAYYIDISGAIISEQPTANAGGAGATCTLYPTSVLCALEVRPLGNYTNTTAANTVTTWFAEPLNVSEFKIYGADFEANETISFLGNPLTARAFVTWQPHAVTCSIGSPCTDSGGGAQVSLGGGPSWAQPTLRGSLILHYSFDNIDIGMQERLRSAIKLYTPVTNPPGTPSDPVWLGPVAYTDLNLGYTIKRASIGTTQAYLTIQNLFARSPQPYAGNGQIANTGQYGGFPLGDDGIGRYFTVGIRFRH